MREFLNSHSISNEIRMLRTVFEGSFLIVEGDLDKRVFQNFIEPQNCQIKSVTYPCNSNKEEVIKIIQILNDDENFTGAIGIIDLDFGILEELEMVVENIFSTDFHDLECLIFDSQALEKVLAEFGSEQKINNFDRNVRETLFEIGSFVGYLRWISLSDELNLTFEGLDFTKFIDKNTLQFDLNKFITAVKNKPIPQRYDINNEQITQQINNLALQNHDKKQIACGKDLVEILSLALQRVLGTKSNENPIDSIRIGSGLRLAYDFEFFATTNLYQNVKIWESENIPFRVFR
jgi:hypothetical protein